MSKKFFLICVISFLIRVISGNAFAQEQITITTYYPSPFGSYRDLETQRLAVAYPAGAPVFWPNFVTVRTPLPPYGDTIAIGGDGAGSDTEIRISAPLTRNTVTFRNVGVVPARLARINAAICLRRRFGPATGTVQCPPNYAIAMAPVAPSATTGRYLCCAFCNDLLPWGAPDGLCD